MSSGTSEIMSSSLSELEGMVGKEESEGMDRPKEACRLGGRGLKQDALSPCKAGCCLLLALLVVRALPLL